MSSGLKGLAESFAHHLSQLPSAVRSLLQGQTPRGGTSASSLDLIGSSINLSPAERSARRDALVRRPGFAIEPRLPSRPVLVILTATLAILAGLCLANVPLPCKTESFSLPADDAPLKLNEEQLAASLPPGEDLGGIEPARSVVTEAVTPPLPIPSTLSQRPSASGPPADLPATDEPLAERIAAWPHERETPMISTKSNFPLQLFLLGWFLSNPTATASASEQAAGEAADRLQKIERSLDDLKTQTAGLKDVNLKDLKEKVDGISKAIELLDKLPLQVQANKRDLDAISNDSKKNATDITNLDVELKRLNQVLTQMLEDAKSESRKAFSPSAPRDPAVPSTSLSTIKLVNAWNTPMTVVIDETSYRLQPGEVRPVTRKAGNFNYEVLGLRPSVSRTLVAGETLTIRIGTPQ